MSGALAFDAAWLFAAFLVVIVLLAAGITARRYLLERGGGTVECGLRVPDGSWRLGVAAYQPDELRWYQIFGFMLRPSQAFSRRTLTVLHRRPPTPRRCSPSVGSSSASDPMSSTDTTGWPTPTSRYAATTGLPTC